MPVPRRSALGRYGESGRAGLPLFQGHIQRTQHQGKIRSLAHRPTDYRTREQVQQDIQMEPALPGADEGHVAHPDAVRLANFELAPY